MYSTYIYIIDLNKFTLNFIIIIIYLKKFGKTYEKAYYY